MILGWDISSSTIGWTVLDDQGEFVECGHIDLTDEDDMISKAEVAELRIRTIIPRFQEKEGAFYTHYVEDRLANFSAGRTMLQTLMKLAAINMVVSYIIHQASCVVASGPKGGGVSLKHIHPSTVKAIMRREGLLIPKGGDKKKLTLDFVSKNVPGWKVELNRNDNPHPFNYDRADSYIVARAGFLRDAQGTKDPGPKALTRAGTDPQG